MVGLGFTPPVDDSLTTPGKIDIYVVDLSAFQITSWTAPDGPVPSSGYADLDSKVLGTPNETAEAAIALAEIFEMRWWYPPNSDDWAWYASAEWLGYKAVGYPAASITDVGPWDVSLDCGDSNPLFQHCANDPMESKGQTRWPFFEFLAQKFGPTFVTSMYTQQNSSGGTALDGLQAALGAKGATLDDVYHDFSVRGMTGGWGVAALDALAAPTAAKIATGTTTESLGSQEVSVDHLSTRYVSFTRGDGAGDHPCFAATLTITVTMPAGLNTRPVFFWNAKGSTPVALAVNGNTATTTVPWDTCLWALNGGLLSLTNASMNDSLDFVVSSSLTVDPNTPATASTAPVQSPIYGGQTNVSNADLPPDISVFGPLVLTVSASSPTIRLVVFSNSEGKLHALLGSVDLGTPSLVPGNNDLRFVLPKSLLSTLKRRLAAGDNVLTLTPVSASGATAGAAVTRTVTVTQAAPKKTKKTKKK
jgi:hypothetical protein